MTVGLDVRWDEVTVTAAGRPIVERVDLFVAGGSWLSLIGPNGAGKTTLVRALAGTVAYHGTITIDGRDTATGSVRGRAKRLAVVSQHPIIPPGLAVFDYVLLGRTPHQGLRFSASVDDRRRVYAVLQRLDLDSFADRRVESLSGGERQRVVLARALAQDTPVLVLDEPTAFLDVGHQLEVLELIADLRDERSLTVITTMHDLSVAGQFADEVAVMAAGRLVATGRPAEVLTPALIGQHWGVITTVDADEYGAVTVTVQRRRESRMEHIRIAEE
ncbi:MAG TPA: ABC transporter ATP-binding protein [Acidimicrobiia bacterium]|nr:ABC transporter ATP-binding protein [Acidimicrobiia bacterium]